MPDVILSQLGDALDRTIAAFIAEQSRPAPPPKIVAHRRKKLANSRKKSEGEARARMLHLGRCEKAFEDEMDERIKTIGAEIRAENLQRMLDLDVNDKEDDQW